MAIVSLSVDLKEIGRFTRFLAVGALGTFLDFALLAFLKASGLSTLFANTLSFSAGVVNNFTWNRLWTFADTKHPNWRLQLIRFLLVSLVGLALNNTIVLVLEAPLGTLLGQREYGYLPAKVFAAGAVVFWNYFANRYWTFRDSSTNSH